MKNTKSTEHMHLANDIRSSKVHTCDTSLNHHVKQTTHSDSRGLSMKLT